jgi:hypothetical protein
MELGQFLKFQEELKLVIFKKSMNPPTLINNNKIETKTTKTSGHNLVVLSCKKVVDHDPHAYCSPLM